MTISRKKELYIVYLDFSWFSLFIAFISQLKVRNLLYLDLDPSYQLPVKRYNVTDEKSNISSFAYTKYEVIPVFYYSHSNKVVLHNIGVGIDRKNAEKDIKKLRTRISEVYSRKKVFRFRNGEKS
jgi:hypothetical protein